MRDLMIGLSFLFLWMDHQHCYEGCVGVSVLLDSSCLTKSLGGEILVSWFWLEKPGLCNFYEGFSWL